MTTRRMTTRRQVLAGMTALCAAPLVKAQAADFPSKPIRIIVPFNAGSGSDETSRVYGEIVGKMLGQSVIVENRPGANANINGNDSDNDDQAQTKFKAGANGTCWWCGCWVVVGIDESCTHA